jgi:hypothetical protein
VQHKCGLAIRLATLLPVDALPIADLEHAMLVRLDRRIRDGHDHDARPTSVEPCGVESMLHAEIDYISSLLSWVRAS